METSLTDSTVTSCDIAPGWRTVTDDVAAPALLTVGAGVGKSSAEAEKPDLKRRRARVGVGSVADLACAGRAMEVA